MIFVLAVSCILLLFYIYNLSCSYKQLIYKLYSICDNNYGLYKHLEKEVEILKTSNSHIAAKLFDLENKIRNKELK